ncbi:zinc ribbon domain-containing protein [Polaromonas sp. JS666]|uniref:zinc ribbon domain-containing protein n=1 Tax=Polaromonas sp. (strain JS666 / ATCC BAA-500) TaxID=296591 RepID=UPI00059B99B8
MSNHSWSVPDAEAIPRLSHSELSEHLRLSKVNPGHYLHVTPLLEKELESRSPTAKYRCMKCGNGEFEVQAIRTARSLLGSVFGVESAKYTAVICRRCSFTEFYNGRVPPGEQALDFVLGR